MPENNEIDYAAFGKGLIDLLEKSRKPSEPVHAKDPEPEIKHDEQKKEEVEVAKPYKKDGVTYIPLKAENVGDVVGLLNNTFHPTSHNSLKCTTCRPIIERTLAGEDFEVKETKDGTITWIPKKTK